MEQNKTYILRVTIGGKLLTYTAKIVSIDKDFVSFIDRFGGKVSINLKNVESYEEVRE